MSQRIIAQALQIRYEANKRKDILEEEKRKDLQIRLGAMQPCGPQTSDVRLHFSFCGHFSTDKLLCQNSARVELEVQAESASMVMATPGLNSISDRPSDETMNPQGGLAFGQPAPASKPKRPKAGLLLIKAANAKAAAEARALGKAKAKALAKGKAAAKASKTKSSTKKASTTGKKAREASRIDTVTVDTHAPTASNGRGTEPSRAVGDKKLFSISCLHFLGC